VVNHAGHQLVAHIEHQAARLGLVQFAMPGEEGLEADHGGWGLGVGGWLINELGNRLSGCMG
jgi:hypothetical protein